MNSNIRGDIVIYQAIDGVTSIDVKLENETVWLNRQQLAEQSATDDIIYWSIISPRHLAAVKGSCPYYRSAEKVRFAKGFKGILENISNKQMREVVSHLISTF